MSFFENQGEAVVHYGNADFTIMKTGAYVLCAVTGDQIPLAQLKYWNHETQEAYRDGTASVEGFRRSGATP